MAFNLDFDNWAVDKQRNYEKKLVRQLLEGCGMSPYAAGSLLRKAGDDFGFCWFNQEFPDCPLALESRRVKSPVSLGSVFRKQVRRQEFWKAYDEVRQNWPDRLCGLVFDHHGDDVGDLVLHDSAWLVGDTEVVVRLEIEDTGPHYLQPWKAFVGALSTRYRTEGVA